MSRELSYHGRITAAPRENGELHPGALGGIATHVEVQRIEYIFPLLGRISSLDLSLDVVSRWIGSRTLHVSDRVDSLAAMAVAAPAPAVAGTCQRAGVPRCRMHSGRPPVVEGSGAATQDAC